MWRVMQNVADIGVHKQVQYSLTFWTLLQMDAWFVASHVQHSSACASAACLSCATGPSEINSLHRVRSPGNKLAEKMALKGTH